MNAEQLMSDLSQAAGLGDRLQLNADGCARVMMDETLAIDFEHQSDHGAIQIYCVLGLVPATGREELYRMLLEGNLFGAETQGASLAVDAEHGDIVLSRCLAIEQMTSEFFTDQVASFMNVAKVWRDRVDSFAPQRVSSEPISTETSFVPMGMRV